MALIHSLCIMLQTTPFHRENYSRLIVGVIVQYYQQCSARFKGQFSSLSKGRHRFFLLTFSFFFKKKKQIWSPTLLPLKPTRSGRWSFQPYGPNVKTSLNVYPKCVQSLAPIVRAWYRSVTRKSGSRWNCCAIDRSRSRI